MNDVANETVIDVRPILAAGETPCEAIEAAVAGLRPGESLVVLAPFEPVPLYTKLGQCGFEHRTEALEGGLWRVEFHPGIEASPGRFQACRGESH